MFLGVILISVPGFIPNPQYGSPEYALYYKTVEILANIRRLFINLALLLISSGLFLGAATIENLPEHAQRGMYVALGLIITGFILNLAFTGLFGY